MMDTVTGLPSNYFSGRNPQEIELLSAVAKRYGLDVAAREVMILHGQVYITASGLNRIALNSPTYDGITIEIVREDWERSFFLVKASVFLKGCAYPVEDYGDSDGSKMKDGARLRHAITRARARAIRAAFAIPFPSEEGEDTVFASEKEESISLLELERSVDLLRQADSFESLRLAWDTVPAKKILAPHKDLAKKRLGKAKLSPRAKANSEAHGLVAAKIDSLNSHDTLRALSGRASLTELSDSEYELLVEKLNRYNEGDKPSEAVEVYAKNVRGLSGEKRQGYWDEWILPAWDDLPVVDRILLLDSLFSEESSSKD